MTRIAAGVLGLSIAIAGMPVAVSAQPHDHGIDKAAHCGPDDRDAADNCMDMPIHGAHAEHDPGDATERMEHAPDMDHAMHHGPPPQPAPERTGAPMEHAAHSEKSGQHGDHTTMQPALTQPDHGASHAIPRAAPPPAAYAGPLFAADEALGAQTMAGARAELAREVSGAPILWFEADRAETRIRSGSDAYLWDVQASYGGDIDKLVLTSEGEAEFGAKPETLEFQALWSHAVGPWWDMQAGIRQDIAGPDRTHVVLGIAGTAPYLVEVEANAFLSHKGDLTASVEAALDLRITQRLTLQPWDEIAFSAQDIPELGVGSGVESAALRLRLLYELKRQFAPYLGVEQEWKVGRSANFAKAEGEDASVTNYLVGLRFWF